MRILPIFTVCFIVAFFSFIVLYFLEKTDRISKTKAFARSYVLSKWSSVGLFVLSMGALYLDIYQAFSNLHLR